MKKFQSECEKVIAQISTDDITKFNDAQDHESRIKIIFKYADSISVDLKEPSKDVKISESEKTKGNSFFAKKDYKRAINAYNAGIINCPQNDDSSKELLAILVANRSAAFFEMQEYKKVLDDIDYIMEIDKYPKHLLYKIWLRKAKCYDAFQNEKSADEIYEQAVECLKYSKLDNMDISSKVEEIKNNRQNVKYKQMPLVKVYAEESFVPHETYVSSHNKVHFDQDEFQGRFARATEDIPVGQIIIQENPHCCVLAPENKLTNCQHCLISTEQVFACPNCPSVIFCSNNCERLANGSYHKFECAFQSTLYESGASINCALALRIITQKNIKFFRDIRRQLKDFLKDNCSESYKFDVYKSENYKTVFFLCRNEFSRNKEELLHYTIMAIYLLKLLLHTDYFHKKGEYKGELSADELFIASLLIRHLESLQFNCHEIAELRNTNDEVDGTRTVSYKLHGTGAALYPTAALFNHSCDPSIIRYNSKNKLIVRTIKPIKKGDIIYENYGPIYTTMKREFRQQFLKKRYWFDCVCSPCVEYWPLLEKMDEQDMKIGCENCSNIFIINKSNIQPFLDCNWCGKKKNLLPILRNLMVLETLLAKAESFYENNDLTGAIKLFLQALNILYDNLKPPCPDMVKIQQRLKTCFVHYGNKMIDYKFSE